MIEIGFFVGLYCRLECPIPIDPVEIKDENARAFIVRSEC